MARTVKEQEYAGKRNGILDAVQRPVYSKGYKLGIKTFDPLTASEPTFNMELVRPGRIA